MIRLIFFSIFYLISSQLLAQTDSVFTLNQCIAYALENSLSLKNAKIDESIAKAKVGEVRGAGLPQVNATGSIVDNPILQRMFLKGDNPFVSQLFPGANPNEVYPIVNLFQLRTSGDVKLEATQLLFSGSYIVGLQAAKTYKELSSKSTVRTKIETIDAVNKAYYLTLINKERMLLLNENIKRLDTLLKQTKSMYNNGFAEQIDVFRIEVSYNNLLTEKSKFENIYELGYLLLKYQMGMPINQKIEISGTFVDIENKVKDAKFVENYKYSDRIEYSLLETQKRANALQIKNIRAGHLPTIALFGTLGAMRMDYKIQRIVSEKWYPYNMYGLSVTLPIFNGFTSVYQAQQAKLALRKTENDISNLELSIDLQIKQSELSLRNQLQTLESQKRNMELSSEVARVSKIKYQQGVGSNLELTDAETSLKEAQTNYYNALYDVIVADLDYQKSLGVSGQ